MTDRDPGARWPGKHFSCASSARYRTKLRPTSARARSLSSPCRPRWSRRFTPGDRQSTYRRSVLIAALGTHYDLLHDVTSPPVGPIAQALRAMNEAQAAGPLAAHLLDPANGEKDVRDVAQALALLATPAEVPTLLRFFALYHSAPAEPEEIPEAANAVAEALLRVGGKEGRAVIDSAMASPMTNAAVRSKLEALKDSQRSSIRPDEAPRVAVSSAGDKP